MREITIVAHCKGIDGAKAYNKNVSFCHHPDCYQCRNFEQVLREEAQRLMESLRVEINK